MSEKIIKRKEEIIILRKKKNEILGKITNLQEEKKVVQKEIERLENKILSFLLKRS